MTQVPIARVGGLAGAVKTTAQGIFPVTSYRIMHPGRHRINPEGRQSVAHGFCRGRWRCSNNPRQGSTLDGGSASSVSLSGRFVHSLLSTRTIATGGTADIHG